MRLIIYTFLLIIPLISLAQPKGIKIIGGTAPEGTERRLALVVGNKDYQHVRKLQNPLNDAADMTKALQSLGFEVITITNTTLGQLIAGINRFKDKLTTSDVALVYYSGHGLSYGGKNYLLPVDAEVRCLEQVEENGVSLNRILGDIAARNVRNSFVFLDACRNLPDLQVCDKTSKDLTGGAGLVRPTNNPKGSMIVFATEEGGTADDNVTGRNGLFTEALLRYLTIPNLSIRAILDKTDLAVDEKSGGHQSPGRYDKIRGEFVFLQMATTEGGNREVTAPLVNANLDKLEVAEGTKAFEIEDFSTAFRLLSRHSIVLNANGQCNLGFMYGTGQGTTQDYNQAVSWYRKSAEQGDSGGQNNLGIMYENGLGVTQDYVQAVSWYRKAAGQGNASAQYRLGYMYELGYGVGKNLTTAVSYYQLAARQGNGLALSRLNYLDLPKRN